MKKIGIVCEYNPLHTGHAALLTKARALGDTVICVMSGNFTQRGDIAIVDKYARAEAAVKTGADLVLELPFPYAMSSAPFFAKGALAVLDSVGIDILLFGSECGDLSKLQAAANAEPAEASDEVGAAKGHFDALGVPLSSNDILGVEYLRAIKKGGYDIEPVVMKRLGDGYREEVLGQSEYASATAIRKSLEEGKAYLPTAMLEILEREQGKGRAPVYLDALEQAILFFWRTAGSLGHLLELGGGLCERLIACAKEATSLSEFYTLAATKKYTNAHIRRASLYGMLGVTWADLEGLPTHTNLLAANAVGCKLLASLRKKELTVPVLTKPSDGQSALQNKADALYTLAQPTPAQAGEFLRRKPFLPIGVDE